MKRVLAFIMASIMLFAAFAAPASAASVSDVTIGNTNANKTFFDSIREFFHKIIGALSTAFNANCPFCDGKHTDKKEVITVTELKTIPTVTIDGDEYKLDVAYNFEPSDTIPTDILDYKYWHADFVITSSINVKDVILAGQYDAWSKNYVGCIVDELKAGVATRVIQTFDEELVGNRDKEITVNVEELFTTVKSFNCGLTSLNSANTGAKITVELRIYETEAPSAANNNSVNVETGAYMTLATVSYTI